MMVEYDLIEGLKALAHPLRWRILCALAAGERNVGEIEQVTGIGQPGLSQQLGVLRKAGMVDTRKEAKLVYYRIASQAVGTVAEALTQLAPAASTAPSPKPTVGVANFARMS